MVCLRFAMHWNSTCKSMSEWFVLMSFRICRLSQQLFPRYTMSWTILKLRSNLVRGNCCEKSQHITISIETYWFTQCNLLIKQVCNSDSEPKTHMNHIFWQYILHMCYWLFFGYLKQNCSVKNNQHLIFHPLNSC